MNPDRTVASGSTIEGDGAILISPSRVQETGSGTSSPCSGRRSRRCRGSRRRSSRPHARRPADGLPAIGPYLGDRSPIRVAELVGAEVGGFTRPRGYEGHSVSRSTPSPALPEMRGARLRRTTGGTYTLSRGSTRVANLGRNADQADSQQKQTARFGNPRNEQIVRLWGCGRCTELDDHVAER